MAFHYAIIIYYEEYSKQVESRCVKFFTSKKDRDWWVNSTNENHIYSEYPGYFAYKVTRDIAIKHYVRYANKDRFFHDREKCLQIRREEAAE